MLKAMKEYKVGKVMETAHQGCVILYGLQITFEQRVD